MPDIIEYIISLFTTFPINVIIIVIIIAYLYFEFFYKKKREEDIFQIEDFRESVYDSNEKLMKTFGIRIDATLTRGIEPIGKITKYYNYKGAITYQSPEDDKPVTVADANLWIFQIGEDSIFSKLFGGSWKDFIIVESDQMETYDGNARRWGLKEDVSLKPYGNCFASSEVGIGFLNDISFRRTQEELLTHVQNFPRKVSYLELKQAKVMERFTASLEQKQAGYDKYKKDVLGAGKEIDEDED